MSSMREVSWSAALAVPGRLGVGVQPNPSSRVDDSVGQGREGPDIMVLSFCRSGPRGDRAQIQLIPDAHAERTDYLDAVALVQRFEIRTECHEVQPTRKLTAAIVF